MAVTIEDHHDDIYIDALQSTSFDCDQDSASTANSTYSSSSISVMSSLLHLSVSCDNDKESHHTPSAPTFSVITGSGDTHDQEVISCR